MRPLIVVSPSVNVCGDEIKLSTAYGKAIYGAGGFMLVSDYGNMDDILERADGILLSGGGDIDPALTGDKADEKHQGQISKERDRFETKLLKRALKLDMPVLGICRGMQVIGAVGGAHIIQNMDGHMQDADKDKTLHFVNVSEKSLLFGITCCKRLAVNSFHHQAVGKGFKGEISAVSEDGFTEAVEFNDRSFVLGVQWHPEHLLKMNEHFNIFREFIKAADRYGERK